MKRRDLDAHELAVEALRRKGGSAPISEIIDYILERRSYAGKTPRNTLSAMLNRSSRVIVSNGICRLRSWSAK